MKSIDELDHYELLEIDPTADLAEIDRAYRLAQQTYADGSLALYSLFENQDAAVIRARLDEAYRVLADAETRAGYDAALAAERPREPAPLPGGPSAALALRGEQAGSPVPVQPSFEEVVPEYDPIEEEDGADFDGSRLRRTRLFRGYELEDVTDITKVSGSHLRNIEEENFADLPADVYVRGFVTAYAKTIGLDPAVVVPSYMARVQQSREVGPRSGFLNRR